LYNECHQRPNFARPIDRKTNKPIGVSRGGRAYRHRVACVRPSASVLKSFPLGSFLSKVEVSADLIVATPGEALALADWVRSKIVQRWHGQHAVRFYDESMYTRPRGRGVVVVVYPRFGQPHHQNGEVMLSKSSNRPCVRIEFRLNGLQVIRRALSIESPQDLPDVDLAAYVAKNMIFEEIDVAAVGRQFLKRYPQKWVRDRMPHYIGHTFVNSSNHSGITQSVRDSLRSQKWCRLDRCFRRIQSPTVVTCTDYHAPITVPTTKPPKN
jgi:hypothetical protein